MRRISQQYWTVPFYAILIGSEQCIDNFVLHYSKYGSVRTCVCVCVSETRVSVGGLHSLSLYNTKPHWYFEKEINIAISSGSCVCASPCLNAFVYFRKKIEWRISTSDEESAGWTLARLDVTPRDVIATILALCSLSTLQAGFPFKTE